MNIEVIKNFNSNSELPLERILINRGIKQEDISRYISQEEKINDAVLLGKEKLEQGLRLLCKNIKDNQEVIVVVDCDADGYCSAAIMINFLYKLYPSWTQEKVNYIMHHGKEHGLSDCYQKVLETSAKLVICPDSASNDGKYSKILKENGIDTLVLDHHLTDEPNEYCVLINNQLSDYPNKNTCGATIVWQFCRFFEQKLFQEYKYSNDFLDLVALANVSDMMDIREMETKYLIDIGFKKSNIKNPFMDYMIDKSRFPLSKSDYISANEDKACTPMGAAFFITPFLNAVTRSGTIEEKCLIFDSMLIYKAFERIPSTKRGHFPHETELLVIQAVRTIGNIKNRQTKAENAGMELLEGLIEENNMMKHSVLLFTLEDGQIESNIRGLVANKIMAKYQKPCIVTTKTDNGYFGSMRGYNKTGILSFKDKLEKCDSVGFVRGHHNAAGVMIHKDCEEQFLSEIDSQLSTFSAEPTYYVDYYFDSPYLDAEDVIISVSYMNDFWGQEVDRPLVGIKFKVTKDNFKVMKSNTLKIQLNDRLSIIKFGGTEQEIEDFTTEGYIEVEAVCKCNRNEWNNCIYPQLILVDYEICRISRYIF